MPSVWYGVQVCQVMCDLAQTVYPGDERSHAQTAPLSAASAVKDLGNSFHGDTSPGILVK